MRQVWFCTTQTARPNFVNRYLHGMHAEELHPTVILFSDDTLFQMSECANPQNERFPMLTHEMPFGLYVTDGVWCAVCASMITEAHFPRNK